MREDLEFDSQGTRCAAWLYRPASGGNSAAVVMGHGFTCVREQRLDAYAERFAQAGMTVLLFDYRHFGASGGEPRQLLSIHRQLQDWEAAIATARALPGVDPQRIALFGTSFSGGHVQTLAERDPSIAAVVAQVPHCDGLRTLPYFGLRHVARLTWAGLRDVATLLMGAEPYRIAAIGEPGELAMLATPGALAGAAKLNPPVTNWRNEVCARIALAIAGYRPGVSAGEIQCPILYCIAENDTITPTQLAKDAAKRPPRAEVKTYPGDHFDPYVPPLWERVVADQTEFLVRHLNPSS